MRMQFRAELHMLFFGAALGAAACAGVVGDTPKESGENVPPPSPLLASQSAARALSQSELDNTLRDLLGDDTRPASRLLPEDQYTPYDNDYTLQSASEARINALEVLAQEVATRALANASVRDRIVPCTPTGPGDAECFRQFVETFAPRALRRPVTSEEVNEYMTLQAFATEDNPDVENDFYTGVNLVIRALVLDPELLYRVEIGTTTEDRGVLALNDYEIASRLSYLLWGTTPDEQLAADAAAGMLRAVESRRVIAERMIGDERAHAQLHRFHSMWLGYRAIPHTATLVTAFNTETNALIDRVVFEERADYLELFRASETYIDATLATQYGLTPPSGSSAAWVPYGDSGRAGILSHGSVLAAFSKFSDTSPTQRGIFVRTRLLCETLPPPPATVDVDQPPSEGTSQCKADRYAEHRRNSSCASCHDRIDPIGLGLENYDIAGRWRDHDDGLPECEIEGVGELPGVGTFSGPKELGERLIENGTLDACAVQQFYTFALGRQPKDGETEVMTNMTAGFRDGGRGLVDMILDFIASEPFARRAEESLQE